MASIIFGLFGYFLLLLGILLMFSATSAGLIMIGAALVLLVKNKSFNRYVSEHVHSLALPSKHGAVHVLVAFTLFVASAAMLPKQATTSAKQPISASIDTSKPTSSKPAASQEAKTNSASVPVCVQEAITDVKELWAQLNDFRYDPEFHRIGYSGGKFHKWNEAREVAEQKYSSCSSELNKAEKDTYFGMDVIHTHLYYVGKDWYQTQGKGNKDSKHFSTNIQYALDNNGGFRQ